MDDLISRQAGIDAFLTELTKRERTSLLHTWSTVEVKYFIAKILEQLPSAQPGWIPTSVRLPEDNEEVLFCDNEGERWLGWHYGFWKTERLDFDEDEVVAWMPLPAPYIPEGDDKHEG